MGIRQIAKKGSLLGEALWRLLAFELGGRTAAKMCVQVVVLGNAGYTFLFHDDEPAARRVFDDPQQTRKRRVRLASIAVILLSLIWAILFVFFNVPQSRIAEEIQLWWQLRQLQSFDPADYSDTEKADPSFTALMAAHASSRQDDKCDDPLVMPARGASTRVFGHIPGQLEWAHLSLERGCNTLDVIVPDWLTIKSTSVGAVVEVAPSDVREPVERFLSDTSKDIEVMPTVLLDTGKNADQALKALSIPEQAKTIAAELSNAAEKLSSNGICLDFRQLSGPQLQRLVPFFRSLSSTLEAGGLTSCMVIAVEQDVLEDARITDTFDHIILKAFRQPWKGSPPGPLAEKEWFLDVVERAIAAIGQERLTIALGNFAVDWTSRQPLPQILPFAEAMTRLDGENGKLTFSPESGNTFASYLDSDKNRHKLWMLDGASFINQLEMVKELGLKNIAVWSLGQEDPGIWAALQQSAGDRKTLAKRMSELKLHDYVSYLGKGPFLRVLSPPVIGSRQLTFDPASGLVTSVGYERLPRPYVLERYGAARFNQVVLTFDDGPHPEYTTDILDILKETGTPGSFFVVGSRLLEEPELARRIIAGGHEIGSHTFSHPRMDLVSPMRAELEHGMSNNLISSYTGRKAVLYREPFMRAGGPIEADRVRALQTVQAKGGIIAGMEIVPKDWKGWTADEITQFVIDEVEKGSGNVILLHDAGEDRRATVEALPMIIRELNSRGYEFTSLANLLGKNKAELMPVVDDPLLLFHTISFQAIAATWGGVGTVFWVVLCIGLFRVLFIFVLAIGRKQAPVLGTGHTPRVSVLIPAHNEQAVIERCVKRVLASDYKNLDVIIVDDGSLDGTLNAALRFQHDPRVSIFSQFNRGKWGALNSALSYSDADIVVCVDADTEIRPDAIRYLVRRFKDPEVGAVAGKVSVGNRNNLLTRLQALEYITAQNFDRLAYDRIKGIFVVPGAIGAWRVEAICEADLFCNDTLTEDADMTVAVTRAGYRVTYEENAVGFTEAPENLRQLMAQRLRWSLGMFQCAWKHKGAIWKGKTIGLVTIPDMLIFGYIFPLLAPIADLFVMILIYRLLSGTWEGEVGESVGRVQIHMILAYFALPLLELLVAAFAVKRDRHEKLGLLWLFPIQRFFYRQLLYFSVFRSLLRALTGALANWGRMERTGMSHVRRRA